MTGYLRLWTHPCPARTLISASALRGKLPSWSEGSSAGKLPHVPKNSAIAEIDTRWAPDPVINWVIVLGSRVFSPQANPLYEVIYRGYNSTYNWIQDPPCRSQNSCPSTLRNQSGSKNGLNGDSNTYSQGSRTSLFIEWCFQTNHCSSRGFIKLIIHNQEIPGDYYFNGLWLTGYSQGVWRILEDYLQNQSGSQVTGGGLEIKNNPAKNRVKPHL